MQRLKTARSNKFLSQNLLQMRKKKLIFLMIWQSFFVLSLLFSGCQKQELPRDYFPLKDGAVYVYNNGVSKRVVEFFKKEKEYNLFKINNFVNDTDFVMVDYFIQTDSTVYWYGFRSLEYGLVYFKPPIQWIPSVSEKDSEMQMTTEEIRKTTHGDVRYKVRLTYYFLGRETITVKAGTFDCIHYRYSAQYVHDIPDVLLMEIGGDWWFAKGIGLVKQESSEMTLELTSYQN